MRSAAAAILGTTPDAVITHLTQTHSAPGLGHFILSEDYPGLPADMDWLRGGDLEYAAWAVERMVEAFRIANGALQPVQVGVGSGVEGRLAHNRRAIGKDGRIVMPGPVWPKPLGPTYIRYLEGPIDPEVGVIALRDQRLRFPSVMVNYACHPVHVFPKPIISADWPGALAGDLAQTYAPDCQPLVLNGCCGNINPWDPFDPAYQADHRRMGRMLATREPGAETIDYHSDIRLDYRCKHILSRSAPGASQAGLGSADTRRASQAAQGRNQA